MDSRDNTRDEMDYISTWNSSIDIKLSFNLSTLGRTQRQRVCHRYF